MRTVFCLVATLVLSGCIALYQDASRQTYADIQDTYAALMAQLDAEEAACRTDECRAEVEARRARARQLGDEADDAQHDRDLAIDPATHDLMSSDIRALKSAWDGRAETLLGELREVRTTTRRLLELDRRLEDVGMIEGALDSTDTLIAQREAAAQTLIVLVRELDTRVSDFVAAMTGASAALDGRTDEYLRIERKLDIVGALEQTSDAAHSMRSIEIYTGITSHNDHEASLHAQRYMLVGGGELEGPGLLGRLDRIESSVTSISTGLANAETALARQVGDAGNQYRALAAILGELEEMRATSQANCLAVQ